MTFVERKVAHNAQYNETTTSFVYEVEVRAVPSGKTCYDMSRSPQRIEEFHVRVPCDCNPDIPFVRRKLVDIEPLGFVDEVCVAVLVKKIVETFVTVVVLMVSASIGERKKNEIQFDVLGRCSCWIRRRVRWWRHKMYCGAN